MIIYIPTYTITLHYITLHYITLHYITLHYITLRAYIHSNHVSNMQMKVRGSSKTWVSAVSALHFISVLLAWSSLGRHSHEALVLQETCRSWRICRLKHTVLSKKSSIPMYS